MDPIELYQLITHYEWEWLIDPIPEVDPLPVVSIPLVSKL